MSSDRHFNSREPLQVVAVSTTMDCILLLYAAILRYGGEPNYRRIDIPEEFADVMREGTGTLVVGLWPDSEFARLAASAVLQDAGPTLRKLTLKNFGGATMVAVVRRSSPALLAESERLTAALDRLLTEIREQANLSEAEALPIARLMTEAPPGYEPYIQSRELVSQDLSNLVTVILGCGEVLAEKLQDHAGRRYVDDLMHATRRVARLLVEFKGARQTHSPVPLDAALVLGAARGLLQTMAGNGLTIAIQMSTASALVSVDRRRLESIAADIVAHARLAVPRGNSVHISVGQITLPDEATSSPIAPGSFVTIAFAYGSVAGAGPAGKTSPPVLVSREMASEMGLAGVLAAVEQSGGVVIIVQTSGQLATLTVFLPSADVSSP